MDRNDIGKNIKRLLQISGMNQAELAARVETSRASISNVISGKSKKTTLLPDIAKALHVSVEDLTKPYSILDDIREMEVWDSYTPLDSDEVELPLFREVELSAGSGSTFVQENHGAKLRFAKSTLAKKGIDPSQAACCFVSGDSMMPVLPDGSTVGINTNDKVIRDGHMYAIDHGGMLRVKYLYRVPSGIKIKSANSDYEDEIIQPSSDSEFRILGRVFWYSVLL